MKYELPENLKTHKFACEKTIGLTSYRSCKRRCPNNYRECWEKHLREDFAQDCAIENEYNARKYVKCSKCGAICNIGLAFNRFLCDACGNVEFCEADEQKALIGDEYVSIDEQELSEMLKEIW